MKEQKPVSGRVALLARIAAYVLFWSWNLIFVTFMLLGFVPLMLPDLLTSVQLGTVPVVFLIFAFILTLIPLVAVVLGFTLLRRSPGKLVALFYGIEMPLMFMLMLRFFVFRDLVPAVALIMIVAALGMITLLWQLLDKNIDSRGPILAGARIIGLSLLLAADLYGSLWVAFYALPLSVEVVNMLGQFLQSLGSAFLRFNWRDLLSLTWAVPMMFLGSILLIYTGTLFVGAPIVVPILAIRSWWRGMSAAMAHLGRLPVVALTTAVLALFIVLFVQTNQQPQPTAFASLKTPPTTPAVAQTIRAQEGMIRSGLLNSYLAQFRYISSVGEVQHIRSMYEYTFHLSPEQAIAVEQLYDIVARPFLYEPATEPAPNQPNGVDGRALREEPTQAAQLYKAYFDQRIIDGEHDLIVNAVRSTWSGTQAEAAWQAVDDRKVLLTHQEITVAEKGDWADIELYEVYQNQTGQRQEVIYYFSLPESAVVTGVWLGNTADRASRSVYRVAPRGAAQAVYRNEVRRNMDPALLEQIGPRQYRLRVFPIEPRRWSADRVSGQATTVDGPAMHMWLTFRVLANNNAWSLPHLAEKRNVYWDATTTRVVNGKTVSANTQDWLPASITAAFTVNPLVHRVDFPGGVTVMAQPLAANDLPKLPGNSRFAVVLDRSRSMSQYAAEVKATLAKFSGAATDVYLTSSAYRGEAPTRVSLNQLKLDSIDYIGGQNAGELLAQFSELSAGQKYAAIFVITDGSGYELGASQSQVPIPNAPVWMVHLGGNLPLGYDDATLEAIQASGGGVVGNVDDAFNRLAVALNPKGLSDATADAITDWVDGYAWHTLPTQAVSDNRASDDNFASIAARRLILSEIQRNRQSLKQLQTLDQLHAIAVKQSVVTPYSSMIVLVNAQQEKLLNQLTDASDRFEREVEDVGDTVAQNPFAVTGVPEPEEWLLLALAAAMLVAYGYKTRIAPRRVRAG